MKVLPDAKRRLSQDRNATLEVVHAGAGVRKTSEPDFVAIPLLPVYASSPAEQSDRDPDLAQTRAEDLLAASKDWCPNPKATICLRVKGNSMSPLILDGYIIAVDTSQTKHQDLIGKIVVAPKLDQGLLVSRLIKFDHTEALISDNRNYKNTASSAIGSGWQIIGKVLWWTGRAN